jgi:hypothetical protein
MFQVDLELIPSAEHTAILWNDHFNEIITKILLSTTESVREQKDRHLELRNVLTEGKDDLLCVSQVPAWQCAQGFVAVSSERTANLTMSCYRSIYEEKVKDAVQAGPFYAFAEPNMYHSVPIPDECRQIEKEPEFFEFLLNYLTIFF